MGFFRRRQTDPVAEMSTTMPQKVSDLWAPVGERSYIRVTTHRVEAGNRHYYMDENGWPPFDKHFFYERKEDGVKVLYHDVMGRISGENKVTRGMMRYSYKIPRGQALEAAIVQEPQFFPESIENFGAYTADLPEGGIVKEIAQMQLQNPTVDSDSTIGLSLTTEWNTLSVPEQTALALVANVLRIEAPIVIAS